MPHLPSADFTPSCRAIVFAVCPASQLPDRDHPLCLLPLGPRSIVQHSIELAVRLGATVVDVVASEGACPLRSLLGDGSRWGISLRLHLVADPEHPYSSLRFLCRPRPGLTEDRCLIIHTQSLVPGAEVLAVTADVSSRSVILYQSSDGIWSGMASVPISIADHLPLEDLTFDHLQSVLENQSERTSVTADVLSLKSAAEILVAQRRVLNGEFPSLLEGYRCAEPGVWIGRNVRIHPTAGLLAPVFISENSEIEAQATVGPGVFLGERTIVGRGALISDSMVLSLSSVGEELTLKDSIVSGSRILNTRLGISLNVQDDLLLGNLERRSVRQALAALMSRIAGIMLLLFTLPLVGAYWLFGGHRSRVRLTLPGIVRTPAPDAEILWRTMRLPTFVHDCESVFAEHDRRSLWRDLVVRIIPSLAQVVMGRVRLAGVMPRSVAQVQAIPEFWKPIILSEPSGLIYESLVQSGPAATFDEACAADLWFVTSGQPFRSARLLLRYLSALVKGPHATRKHSASQPEAARRAATISSIRRNPIVVSTRLLENRHVKT